MDLPSKKPELVLTKLGPDLVVSEPETSFFICLAIGHTKLNALDPIRKVYPPNTGTTTPPAQLSPIVSSGFRKGRLSLLYFKGTQPRDKYRLKEGRSRETPITSPFESINQTSLLRQFISSLMTVLREIFGHIKHFDVSNHVNQARVVVFCVKAIIMVVLVPRLDVCL